MNNMKEEEVQNIIGSLLDDDVGVVDYDDIEPLSRPLREMKR